MKLRLYTLLILFSLTITGFSQNKKVKISSFTTYEGGYDKNEGFLGKGTLKVKTSPKKNVLEAINSFSSKLAEFSSAGASTALQRSRTYSQNSANRSNAGAIQSEAPIFDYLTGTFKGYLVTNAQLRFNSGWTFTGNLDFTIESTKDKDVIEYHLGDGEILIPNGQYSSNAVALSVQKEFNIRITRTIQKGEISVNSTSIPIVKPDYNKVTIRKDYDLASLLGSQYLAKLELGVLSQNYSVNNKEIIEEEKWALKQEKNQENIYYDTNGNRLIYTDTPSLFTLHKGDDVISVNDSCVANLDLNYTDAHLKYDGKTTVIKYKNGETYEGAVFSKTISAGWYYLHFTRSLSELLGKDKFADTGLEPYTGELKNADGTVKEVWRYGHKVSEVKTNLFPGSWILYAGKPDSDFKEMKREGILYIYGNGTYEMVTQNIVRNEFRTSWISKFYGTWKAEGNYLILNSDTKRALMQKSVYPNGNHAISIAELTRLNQEAKADAEAETAKYRKKTDVSSPFDLYRIEEGYGFHAFFGNIPYSFRKVNGRAIELKTKDLIGRWGKGNSNTMFEFNGDGTYAEYITSINNKRWWTERFVVARKGRWYIDGDCVITIDDPSQCLVQIRMENINPLANQAQVNARKKEMNQEALIGQERHRKDTPRPDEMTVTHLGANAFYSVAADGRDLQFFRVQ